MKKSFLVVLGLGVGLAMASTAIARSTGQAREQPARPSTMGASVTVYGASWCSACRSLEKGLRDRDIPFATIDVEKNPEAHAKAKNATGSNAIPVTSIARRSDTAWVVGADAAAVERAYR